MRWLILKSLTRSWKKKVVGLKDSIETLVVKAQERY